MKIYAGVVQEVAWQAHIGRYAQVRCPAAAIPPAGKYSLAWAPSDSQAALPSALFLQSAAEDGFVCAPPTPAFWEPGAALWLSAPHGRGFNLPPVRRLALAACDPAGLARLRPLMQAGLRLGAAVALFTPHPAHDLPMAVEVNPLSALPEGLLWADYLAADLPAADAPRLPAWLGLSPGVRRLPCPAQALLAAPMPCGGAGDCGACHLLTRRGWKAVCEDGPVFDIDDLLL